MRGVFAIVGTGLLARRKAVRVGAWSYCFVDPPEPLPFWLPPQLRLVMFTSPPCVPPLILMVTLVRPDEQRLAQAIAGAGRSTGWTSLGGVSPLPVSAGAPGSRSRVRGEILVSQAGCRKPKRRRIRRDGKQARGPQHEVKPAASSDLQSGSRAAHVTVKAMFVTLKPDGVTNSGGVGGAARVQRDVRNRRGPSDESLSRQVEPYKPKVKAVAGQRESEGVVVP